jgi:two-component system chemotaxis response regulator CheY
MRILIAEDDAVSRIFINKLLSSYGECDLTVNGIEAIDAFLMALDENKPYDLICLDIMMPKVDGMKALKIIRDLEQQRGISKNNRVKIVMTTALSDSQLVLDAFEAGCEAYAAKPIDSEKLVEVLKNLNLI